MIEGKRNDGGKNLVLKSIRKIKFDLVFNPVFRLDGLYDTTLLRILDRRVFMQNLALTLNWGPFYAHL